MLVGVRVDVLLRQTKVHNVQSLVFLHARPETKSCSLETSSGLARLSIARLFVAYCEQRYATEMQEFALFILFE